MIGRRVSPDTFPALAKAGGNYLSSQLTKMEARADHYAEGIVLDMCPTANRKCKAVTSMSEHPLPRLVRDGVRCTISTDSRTVADTTLTHEYELMARAGMTEDELRLCNETAYRARFG